ncbi:hypothetical protein IT399_03090 [Candidatus Nomurabacteria bacterium]|nr:hypothetical protein [Candidatus Nomurabacteria bacterium]
MIYLFSGDDAKNKIINYEKFIKTLPSEIEILSINRNNFDRMQVQSLYSGSGLFFAKSAIIFSGVFDYEETREFVLEKLSLMGESENLFIFLESKLNKPILDAFKKARAEVNIFELPKEKKEKFDNFLVANAFANKDKLNTWIYFRQAMDVGVGMEEIIGVLFWKIKDMILRKNFSKFKEGELKDFASRISYLLPEARKESRDAESAFEQFLLEAF